jgi:hypothetical protein
MLTWPHHYGLMLRQKIMVRRVWWVIIDHFIVIKKQRERGDRARTRYSPKSIPPRTQLPSARFPFLFPSPSSSPPNYQSMDRLIHLLDQSPYDPVTSQKPHLWTLVHWSHMSSWPFLCIYIGGNFRCKPWQLLRYTPNVSF